MADPDGIGTAGDRGQPALTRGLYGRFPGPVGGAQKGTY